MKPEFQRWYEAVQLTLDPQVMEARWAALQALAESINDAELEALARAAFRSDQTTAATATVRTKLADKGGAMADEEFALLAAAALAVILQRDEPAAARAATMICTAHFKNLRTLRQPMDLVGLGATARVALARTSRRRPPLELEPMPSLEVDTTPAEETEDSNESIRLLAGAFTEAMQQIADRQADFEERALRYISIQDEELNMLWWLQGGRTQATRYFVKPDLLRSLAFPAVTTLKRIEDHRLRALVLEDLGRYPQSSIGDIQQRIGPEIARRRLQSTLAHLVDNGEIRMQGVRRWTRYSLAL